MPASRSQRTHSRSQPRRWPLRWPSLGATVAGVMLLTSCLDNRAPLLAVAPAEELHMSSQSSNVVVRNVGGQMLDWYVISDDPRVSATPSEGRIFATGSVTVAIDIDTAQLDKADVLTATLMFRSNGGDAETLVRFAPESGIGRCGGYLPYELPLTAAWQPLRTALPGVGAVPVGNEILVAYRPAGPGAGHEAAETSTSGALHRPDRGTPDTSTVDTLILRTELQAQHGLSLLAAGAPGAPDLYTSVISPEVAIKRLLDDPRVLYAQRNYYLELQGVPNDPYLADLQWNLTHFGLPEAWEVYDAVPTPGDVVLAVLDSGVFASHPDLAPKLLPGWDFHGRDSNTEPGVPDDHNDAAHGTHVAGIAAAVGGDGIGVAGVAFGPEFKVVPVKVFDDIGAGGTISGLVEAIRWSAGLAVPGTPANPHRAAVINMSLGVAGRHPALEGATLDAWNAGAVLVAAAGNHNAQVPDRGILSPGNAPCVIAVGSVDDDYSVSDFTNHGPQAELLAPGGYSETGCHKVYSTVPPTPVDGGPDEVYGCLAGTSMAAPFVSGVAALLIAQGEHAGPAAVRTRLSQTAFVDDGLLDHSYYGNGVVCADAALGAPSHCGVPLALTAATARP